MLTNNLAFISPVVTPYDFQNAGIFVTKDSIFVLNQITNCDVLSWSFGDTCGGPLTGIETVEETINERLFAINNVKDGYTKSICLRCDMTNGYFIEKSFEIT